MLKASFGPLALIVALAAPAGAQTERQNFEAARKTRPAQLTSTARIADAAEPGTPFVVRGTILDPAGKPASGVEVFAYHTDNTGLYAAPGAAEPWRLKGWAVTDAKGEFAFGTIRPGAYPGRAIPAHVHFIFTTPCCGRQVSEVMFEDDPLATPEVQRQSNEVLWGAVRKTAAGQDVSYTFRLKPRGES
jgi:protocatechuate 3,4-dioxygenase beta subunit